MNPRFLPFLHFFLFCLFIYNKQHVEIVNGLVVNFNAEDSPGFAALPYLLWIVDWCFEILLGAEEDRCS